MDREMLRAHILEEWQRKHTDMASTVSSLKLVAAAVANEAKAPETAKAFLPFKRLDLRADGEFLYVGSDGIPDHQMMIGITAWQQQVPLPQSYFEDNAWRIPLNPVPAQQPAMIKGRFLRGAIALGVNGIPIFNPQNNRGDVSYEIGELDEWGGHCGRGDDYHYHIVPLHLESTVGRGKPVAYGLDGYPVLGLTEEDGTAPVDLDVCHGHDHDGLGYHYHASMKYPYVFAGFHGEVVEANGQVDPQPRAQPVREALQALRGAEITGFEATGPKGYKVLYTVNGDERSVAYSIEDDGRYPFVFDNGRDGVVEEVYQRRGGGGGEGRGGKGGQGGGQKGGKGGQGGKKGGKGGMRPDDRPPPPREGQGDRPPPPPRPRASAAGPMLDLNGDGVVTAQEFAGAARRDFSSRGGSDSLEDAMAAARSRFYAMDKNRDGQLDRSEWQPPSGSGAPPSRSETMARNEDDRPPSGGNMERRGGGGGGPRGHGKGSPGEDPNRKPWIQVHGEEFDADGDGVLTGEEMAAEAKRAFSGYDADRDGTLSVQEQSGPGARTAMGGFVKQHPDKIDTNADGLMTEEELVGLAMKMFGKEDKNGDGRLTPNEWQSSDSPPSAPMKGIEPGPGQDRIQNMQEGPEEGGPGGKRKGGGKGKGGPPGLVKPKIDDTMRLSVYADNWFMLYVNGRLVAVDSIQFTPHNVVSVDFLPEYPMTIAVLAKDNADPETGLEYGSSIGDGGFILKFGDGTVTNATWKARSFFHGPLNGDTVDPQVQQGTLPDHWWAVDFDDNDWSNAKEYTVEAVDPKQPYYESDFDGAAFIWTDDLALDNTVIFRTRVDRPDWTQRWNTTPDLDVTGAPLK
jgi:hypothetical protein